MYNGGQAMRILYTPTLPKAKMTKHVSPVKFLSFFSFPFFYMHMLNPISLAADGEITEIHGVTDSQGCEARDHVLQTSLTNKTSFRAPTSPTRFPLPNLKHRPTHNGGAR